MAAHPNLIAYHDSFLEDTGFAPRLVIVMSFAEDGDLRSVVMEARALERTIPEQVVLIWMRQIFAGLSHIHAQAVIHRDLKTANVFLSKRRRRILIGDFGISKVLESTLMAGTCVGTPAYMSPEIMQNERYDYQADMWACGVICYELCTLDMPFKGTSLIDLMVQVVESEPNWGNDKWTSFSSKLKDVVKYLLEKEPSKRPTATNLLEDSSFSAGQYDSDVLDEVWACVMPEKTNILIGSGCSETAQNTSKSNASTTIGSGSESTPTKSSWGDQALDLSLDDFQAMIAAESERCDQEDRAATYERTESIAHDSVRPPDNRFNTPEKTAPPACGHDSQQGEHTCQKLIY